MLSGIRAHVCFYVKWIYVVQASIYIQLIWYSTLPYQQWETDEESQQWRLLHCFRKLPFFFVEVTLVIILFRIFLSLLLFFFACKMWTYNGGCLPPLVVPVALEFVCSANLWSCSLCNSLMVDGPIEIPFLHVFCIFLHADTYCIPLVTMLHI